MKLGKFQIELSNSQLVALIDLVAVAIRCRCDARIEQSSTPEATTPGELLRIISGARYVPAPEEIPDTKARVV